MTDDATRSWIATCIRAALDHALTARAAARSLDDDVLAGAATRLADDLEAFAVDLAVRLADLDDERGDHRRPPAPVHLERAPRAC
jgi:hypothetical protein